VVANNHVVVGASPVEVDSHDLDIQVVADHNRTQAAADGLEEPHSHSVAVGAEVEGNHTQVVAGSCHSYSCCSHSLVVALMDKQVVLDHRVPRPWRSHARVATPTRHVANPCREIYGNGHS